MFLSLSSISNTTMKILNKKHVSYTNWSHSCVSFREKRIHPIFFIILTWNSRPVTENGKKKITNSNMKENINPEIYLWKKSFTKYNSPMMILFITWKKMKQNRKRIAIWETTRTERMKKRTQRKVDNDVEKRKRRKNWQWRMKNNTIISPEGKTKQKTERTEKTKEGREERWMLMLKRENGKERSTEARKIIK